MNGLPKSDRVKVYGPEYVSRELRLEGLVKHPRTYTSRELRQRPRVSVDEVPVICGTGRLKQPPARLEGVRLRDLLEEAEIVIEAHEDPNRILIVASGNDGYRALFSWHEIFNSPAGDRLLAVLEKNGEPLEDSEGELCLVSAGDSRPGPRRIRYLSRILVRKIEI